MMETAEPFRLEFGGSKVNAPFPSAVVVFGPKARRNVTE